jgi:hypothetical protein
LAFFLSNKEEKENQKKKGERGGEEAVVRRGEIGREEERKGREDEAKIFNCNYMCQ